MEVFLRLFFRADLLWGHGALGLSLQLCATNIATVVAKGQSERRSVPQYHRVGFEKQGHFILWKTKSSDSEDVRNF